MKQIIMVVDNNEYVYGTYEAETSAQINAINKLALDIAEQRQIETYVIDV
jgi:hypothetical protein